MQFEKITSKKKRSKMILYFRRPLTRLCMVPTFLIIGAQKSGTSSLFNYLIQHPDIISPIIPREVHYFDLYYNRGPQWYMSNFPLSRKGKITGEKSPYYLYHPLVPERSLAFNSGFRLIVLLRDPVKRAYSHYNHQVRKGRESRPFREAVKTEMNRVESEHDRLARGEINYSFTHQHYSYLSRGRYVEQLDLWTKFFPRKQIYLETSERFFREPQTVCSEIFQFLDLPPATISSEKRHNSRTYDPILKTDQEWLANLFHQSNAKLADEYGVDINNWL